MHQLNEIVVKNPVDLSCSFFSKEQKENDKIDVLIVSFFGKCLEGSAGRNHGNFIARKTIEGLMVFDADVIVLDFREMNYTYGNSLLKVFQDISQFKDAGNNEDEPEFPIIVVTSSKSKSGVLSLLMPANSNEIPDWHFEDIDKAIDVATEKGEYWLNN